mmetsp:Transcript_40159/g.64948  ORF Transcript_40159/g.64948 Transcript_40159/m.64948 type:complete len:86 (-) Transcript_40159:49-306(-)
MAVAIAATAAGIALVSSGARLQLGPEVARSPPNVEEIHKKSALCSEAEAQQWLDSGRKPTVVPNGSPYATDTDIKVLPSVKDPSS